MCISALCNMQRERDIRMVMWSGIGIRIDYRIIRGRDISKVDGFQVVYAFLLPGVPRVVHMSGRGPVSVHGSAATSKI